MRALLASSIAVSLAACGTASVETEPVTGSDGAAAVSYSDCEQASVVAWVNDPATTTAVLKSAGVTARAATNLVARKPYGSFAAVDAVPQVGPATLEALVAAIAERCEGLAPADVEPIFSPQPMAQSHL